MIAIPCASWAAKVMTSVLWQSSRAVSYKRAWTTYTSLQSVEPLLNDLSSSAVVAEVHAMIRDDTASRKSVENSQRQAYASVRKERLTVKFVRRIVRALGSTAHSLNLAAAIKAAGASERAICHRDLYKPPVQGLTSLSGGQSACSSEVHSHHCLWR